MQCYLIAFGGRPKPTFLDSVIELSRKDGVEIRGAVLTTGPGCFNLAIMLDEPNVPYVAALTTALMPAKYCETTDPKLQKGVFLVEV
jgi:hypothetical protein